MSSNVLDRLYDIRKPFHLPKYLKQKWGYDVQMIIPDFPIRVGTVRPPTDNNKMKKIDRIFSESTPKLAGAGHPTNTAREPLEPAANESAIGKLSHWRDPPDCPEDPGLRPTRVRRIHTLNCSRRNVWLIIHCQDHASFQLD